MSDDFNARYRLLKCVAVDDGIRSHNAQELATGRVVMVHLADAAGPEDVDRLRAMLTRLPGAEKNRVLDTATLPTGFAIVTEFLPGLTSFPTWLAARVSSGDDAPVAEMPPAPTPVPTPVPAPVPTPGAFTQMFGAPSIPTAPAFTPVPEPEALDQVPPMLAQETPSLDQYPALNTTQGGIPASNPRTEPVAPPASVSPKTGPGEFTQMFAAPSTAAPLPGILPPSPIAPAAWSPVGSTPLPNVQRPAAMPGLVTPPSFMAAPSPSAPAPAAPTPFPPMPPSLGNGSPVFGNAPIFSSAAPAASAPVAPLPITPFVAPAGSGLGASPIAASPLGASPGLPSGVLPPPMFGQAGTTPLSPMGGVVPAASTGPSDFTRLITRAPAPVVPPAPAPAAPKPTAAAPAKQALPIGLIVVINVVLLLAVIVIVFVLRQPQPIVPSKPAVPRVPRVNAPALKK